MSVRLSSVKHCALFDSEQKPVRSTVQYTMTYKCLPFYKLNLDEIYAIMALRQEVFVVEQNCPYLDADGNDQESWHLMGFNENKKLIAYTRLLPLGVTYKKYAAIGRVVTSPSARGLGAGKKIMEASIEWLEKLFPNQPVKISAQVYLLKFYNELGFQEIGEEYLEDDIPHIAMLYKSPNSSLHLIDLK